MKSHYASPERAGQNKLAMEIEIVSGNPVVSGLLHSISGLLAILDRHRQIVAVNDTFINLLGIEDAGEVLGLRPGEALSCIHAHEEPAGCGTTKYCATCGAAVAIVACLGQDRPVERICALSAKMGDKVANMALLVRSHPLIIDQQKFVLLFLQDITQQEQQAALERTFFHDINNLLNMLVGASELLAEDVPAELAGTVHRLSLRLMDEVAMQRLLLTDDEGGYRPLRQAITARHILAELQALFANHPAAQGRGLDFQAECPSGTIHTDISLVIRVLCNMIVNALEATPPGGVVRIWITTEDEHLSFCVWNAQEIEPQVAHRIFQRNFSTKKQAGRGIGTFSMKLFGEKLLGGQVRFTTSGETGTVFRLTLPRAAA